MQLNGFSFNKLWLESLYTKSVERWSTVQKNGMSFQYIFQNIPDHRIFSVDDLLRRLNCLYYASFNKLADNKWLEQFSSHVFWKTAFMKFQLRTHDDYGTTGVVDTLTE